MQRLLTFLLNKLGSRYITMNSALVVIGNVVAVAAALLEIEFCIAIDHAQVVRLLVVAEVLTVFSLVLTGRERNWPVQGIREWLGGSHDPAQTVKAWRLAVGLPMHSIRSMGYSVIVVLPWTVYTTVYLDLNAVEGAALFLGSYVVVGYIAILRYFQAELTMRPVVIKIARDLPAALDEAPPVFSLRWKLLAGIPMINIITGVVVSAISAPGRAGLLGLGVDVLVAVAVAFTISLELSLLLSRSILLPVHELLRGAERVARGDYQVRVPVTSNDEIGQLTRGFNEMVHGLAEREQLHGALGSYVDPDVADRILSEGELLAGEEVEVTVLFFDVKDFTTLSETLLPRQTVSLLNGLFELVVPILQRHGGHSIKFVGDGGMTLFGAPELHADHADRAVTAAQEVVTAIEQKLAGELDVGIGINSGRVLVGSIGGGGCLEFTAIGDAVNVASRVERATRETGDPILITEATKNLLRSTGEFKPRLKVPLKGRAEPVALYALG